MFEHHRHHHRGGSLMLIAMSLDNLGLPDEEQTRVDRIQSDLLAKMHPAGLAERSLATVLADGVASAKLDPAKVKAAIDELGAASAGAHDAAADDLNQLHALLTAPQRAALIDKLEAQWALWKRANTGDQSHFATIATSIGLLPDQIETARKNFAALTSGSPLREAEVESHLHHFETAFQADSFDAKALSSAPSANRDMAGWGAGRLASFCEAVNPTLNDDQRGKLAALLREHTGHDAGQAGGAP
jgi:Spy/CpxP family protein refolding chaperone